VKLEGKHWAILGALVVTLGLHLKGASTWAALLQPSSVGELLFQIGTVIGALLVGSPLTADGKADYMSTRDYQKIGAWLLALVLGGAALSACASAPPDTTHIAAARRLQVALVTRDVVTAAKAANAAHELADRPTGIVLHASDQVLQALVDAPQDYPEVIRRALRLARDALTADDQAAAVRFLDRIEVILKEVTSDGGR
jgi:hypothetical protein